MKIKRQILFRIYSIYILLLLVGSAVVWKLCALQYFEGRYWRGLENKLHRGRKKIDADRGTIYSADRSILSASIPFYDLYLDFSVSYIRENRGYNFRLNLDSLALGLSNLFKDQSPTGYAQNLRKIYSRNKVVRFKKNLSYEEKKIIQTLPLVREGRFKSGFQFVEKSKRRYPYGNLAKRTIGFVRDYQMHNNVGLESFYDKYLRGDSGYQLVRYISGGAYALLDGYNVEPNRGKDIITTIDVHIQDIAEHTLLKMLKRNHAEWGTVVVMEVATGKIRAIANLGIDESGEEYFEKINYALRPLELGSTFKLVSLLALLDGKNLDLESEVEVFGGEYKYAKNSIMKDSEKHKLQKMTVKTAFANSSNVGISRLVMQYYSQDPMSFFHYMQKLHLNLPTGIDLVGEEIKTYITPENKYWNKNTSLAWLSIGYGAAFSPMQILMVYNAIANGGMMMRPYLVSDIYEEGKLVKKNLPKVLETKICKTETLNAIKKMLHAVTTEGTARQTFHNTRYKVAGKTGTSLFYGTDGYRDSIYHSSFIGFFPLERPIYTCAVFIKNHPKALNYYGSSVAAPVFREIADKLYVLANVNNSLDLEKTNNLPMAKVKHISSSRPMLNLNRSNTSKNFPMPNLLGKHLRELPNYMERYGLRIVAKGSGSVVHSQSVAPGTMVSSWAVINVEL